MNAFSPGRGLEAVQQVLQLLVELQDHLAHQRRAAAHLVPQASRGVGHQADEIEGILLCPSALLFDQADQQFELGGLAQRRGLVEIQESLRVLRVVGEGAQRRSAGLRRGSAIHVALCLLSNGFSSVEFDQPCRRLPEGGELAAAIHPELPAFGCAGEQGGLRGSPCRSRRRAYRLSERRHLRGQGSGQERLLGGRRRRPATARSYQESATMPCWAGQAPVASVARVEAEKVLARWRQSGKCAPFDRM